MPFRDSTDDLDPHEGDSDVFDDDADTVPCPQCGQAVYEDAERCPHCENYISQEDAPSRKPAWIVGGTLLCLFLAVGWALGC